MLDTLKEEECDEIEAVRRIDARVAVEAPQPTESAMLDRGRETAIKPRPQPRTAPPREKRRKKR